MKFKVGDLVKWCGQQPGHNGIFLLALNDDGIPENNLIDTFGIIIEAFRPEEFLSSEHLSTDKDNGYFWFSQLNQLTYLVYEDEIKYDNEQQN